MTDILLQEHAEPIIDPFYPIIDHPDWLKILLPCGVRSVQLRLKNLDFSNRRLQIKTAQSLCKDKNVELIINDDWELALDLGGRFVHLGQGDIQKADIPALKQAGIRLGISTHNEEELACALTYAPDYIALGPVFTTKTKIMPFSPQGLPRVSEWKKKIDPIPLVAIGGITLERAAAVFEAGADSLAMIQDIRAHKNPLRRCRDWLALTSRYRYPPQANDPAGLREAFLDKK